ncbi:MAG: isocitrate lyase/phosphoenolpyruvate mutase family protein [Pseudomonadota bacterium]
MTSVAERHKTFERLHESGCFVLPNPWDAGSARVMAASGAKALATTSAGHAFTLGRPDGGTVTRDEALSHAQDLLAATPLPLSGDFENGFGDTPEDVAETVRRAGEIGLSGCSIEDTIMGSEPSAYQFEFALERVEAGVAAARALNRPFIFCARTDGIMNGVYDTDEAIRRLKAFENAGADLLYAPLPPSMVALQLIVKSVTKPVNALVAGDFRQFQLKDFAAIGVRRCSLGSSIARLTHHHIVAATRGMCQDGDFSALENTASGDMIDEMLRQGADD